MSFEHDILRSTVRDLLAKDSDPWPRLATEIGVAELATESALEECYLVLEELGRVLSPAPMLSTVIAAQALVHAGTSQYLEGIASGDILAALALDGVSLVDGHLQGTASHVLDGDRATVVLVAADGDLYAATPSQVTPLVAVDQTRHLATLTFDGVPGDRLGPFNPKVRDIACLALAAEQVGAMERALELTVEYTKLRVQFGRPIASFQALQHRMADLHVLATTARSVQLAAVLGSTLPGVAKVHCAEAFQRIAGEMIQLHGGIGITWEHDAHRYFKRAYGSAQLFGHPRTHLRALADYAVTSI